VEEVDRITQFCFAMEIQGSARLILGKGGAGGIRGDKG